jgi:ABC-type Fe3+-hydroxamate transport system substrate-binding protein
VQSTKTFVDQLGREVVLPTFPPKRIVSLVPSQTELLHAMGLEEEVVGITKFCIFPKEWAKSKKKIGGTKNAKIDEILALKPDLIIANKEENEKGTLELLQQFCPVWISDVRSLDAALDMIQKVSVLTGVEAAGFKMHDAIKQSFDALKPVLKGKRILYAIWRDPWMFAGADTFIGDIIVRTGAINVIEATEDRYPVLSLDHVKDLNADVVLLSSEPYPFKQKHILELHGAGIKSQVIMVNGAFFSWYGSHLLGTVSYLENKFVKI